MWHTIKTSDDIADFLRQVNYFHDSCIKQLQYVSGSYVSDNLSMHAINDMRQLTITIQQQNCVHRTIELEFYGLVEIRMAPESPLCTSEMLGAAMLYEDNLIKFSDSASDKPDKEGTIYICAEKVKWRFGGHGEDTGAVLLSPHE